MGLIGLGEFWDVLRIWISFKGSIGLGQWLFLLAFHGFVDRWFFNGIDGISLIFGIGILK